MVTKIDVDKHGKPDIIHVVFIDTHQVDDLEYRPKYVRLVKTEEYEATIVERLVKFQRVEVYHEGHPDQWYGGVIHTVNTDGTFKVIYDDEYLVGSSDGRPCEWGVPEHLIRPKTIAVDTRVEVDYTNLKGGDVAPGTVCGVNGDGSYVVVLDAQPRASPPLVQVTVPRGTHSMGTFEHKINSVKRTLRCPLDAKGGSTIFVDPEAPPPKVRLIVGKIFKGILKQWSRTEQQMFKELEAAEANIVNQLIMQQKAAVKDIVQNSCKTASKVLENVFAATARQLDAIDERLWDHDFLSIGEQQIWKMEIFPHLEKVLGMINDTNEPVIIFCRTLFFLSD